MRSATSASKSSGVVWEVGFSICQDARSCIDARAPGSGSSDTQPVINLSIRPSRSSKPQQSLTPSA